MEGKTHVLGAEAICLSLTVSGIYHPETFIAAGEFFIAAGFPVLPAVNGLTLGVLSHILLDMLNPKGVCLFFPWKKKISIGKIRTGGVIEKIFFLCLVVLCGYLIFRMVQPYIAGLSFPVIKERFVGLFK